MATCDSCDRVEDDDARTFAWTLSVEHGQRRTYCEECSRTHLRAMEGKLDAEFW